MGAAGPDDPTGRSMVCKVARSIASAAAASISISVRPTVIRAGKPTSPEAPGNTLVPSASSTSVLWLGFSR